MGRWGGRARVAFAVAVIVAGGLLAAFDGCGLDSSGLSGGSAGDAAPDATSFVPDASAGEDVAPLDVGDGADTGVDVVVAGRAEHVRADRDELPRRHRQRLQRPH